MTRIEYLWRLPTHGDGRRARDEHIQIGASTFIPASNPPLEEACRVGEEVLPRVPAALERVRARQTSAA